MSKELIRRAKKGDERALNELIEQHKDLAFTIAYKYLNNEQDAQDVTQNAFIIILKAIKKFRNESKFSTWLYRIIYHECIKELKSKKKNIEFIPQFAKINAEDLEDHKDINTEDLLSHLNPSEFTVITLFYLKEKSIEEINKITSFSKSNIKVILHRSRVKLRRIYNDKKDNNGE